MKRREFLKTAAAATLGFAMLSRLPAGRLLAAGTEAESPVDLVGVMGGSPEAMFQHAIAEFGGMERFVRPGARVVVKPNIGWDQPPEMGADTNPELVGAIVRACVACGAAEVAVFDHTCNEWTACYRNSGIAEAVQAAGGKMYPGNSEDYYESVKIPKAKIMKRAKVHSLVPACDTYINVPVLKHHGGASMTAGMKNYMGIVWDRGYMHEHGLHQCIADSVLIRPADLTIIDAYRVMTANGPRGVSSADVTMPQVLLMARDPVAADTAAAMQARFNLDQIGHLKCGEQAGLGTMDLDRLAIRKIALNGQ